MKILPVGAEFIPCGQTDRLDETNNHFHNLRTCLYLMGCMCKRKVYI